MVGPADVASRLNGVYRMDEKNRYYFTLLYGLLHALDESRELTLDESVQSLVELVLSWHGVTQLSDDLSVLAVEVQ